MKEGQETYDNKTGEHMYKWAKANALYKYIKLIEVVKSLSTHREFQHLNSV